MTILRLFGDTVLCKVFFTSENEVIEGISPTSSPVAPTMTFPHCFLLLSSLLCVFLSVFLSPNSCTA